MIKHELNYKRFYIINRKVLKFFVAKEGISSLKWETKPFAHSSEDMLTHGCNANAVGPFAQFVRFATL